MASRTGRAVRPLVVVGSGGFGRETVEAVRAINSERPTWDLVGFLDDDLALHGKEMEGLPVLGPIDEARDRFESAALVVCTGGPRNYFTRKRIVERLGLPAARYATIVHPTVSLSSTSGVGQGSVLLAYVVATASVTLGAHVAVMPGVVFTHDDVVEDYATFGAGARLAGRVHVEEGAYVGSGALIREDRTIGAWALVGMGAVATRDIPTQEVWAGVPAAPIRPVSVPAGMSNERAFEADRARPVPRHQDYDDATVQRRVVD